MSIAGRQVGRRPQHLATSFAVECNAEASLWLEAPSGSRLSSANTHPAPSSAPVFSCQISLPGVPVETASATRQAKRKRERERKEIKGKRGRDRQSRLVSLIRAGLSSVSIGRSSLRGAVCYIAAAATQPTTCNFGNHK